MEMMAILKNFENSGKLKIMAPEGQTCIFFYTYIHFGKIASVQLCQSCKYAFGSKTCDSRQGWKDPTENIKDFWGVVFSLGAESMLYWLNMVI